MAFLFRIFARAAILCFFSGWFLFFFFHSRFGIVLSGLTFIFFALSIAGKLGEVQTREGFMLLLWVVIGIVIGSMIVYEGLSFFGARLVCSVPLFPNSEGFHGTLTMPDDVKLNPHSKHSMALVLEYTESSSQMGPELLFKADGPGDFQFQQSISLSRSSHDSVNAHVTSTQMISENFFPVDGKYSFSLKKSGGGTPSQKISRVTVVVREHKKMTVEVQRGSNFSALASLFHKPNKYRVMPFASAVKDIHHQANQRAPSQDLLQKIKEASSEAKMDSGANSDSVEAMHATKRGAAIDQMYRELLGRPVKPDEFIFWFKSDMNLKDVMTMVMNTSEYKNR